MQIFSSVAQWDTRSIPTQGPVGGVGRIPNQPDPLTPLPPAR